MPVIFIPVSFTSLDVFIVSFFGAYVAESVTDIPVIIMSLTAAFASTVAPDDTVNVIDVVDMAPALPANLLCDVSRGVPENTLLGNVIVIVSPDANDVNSVNLLIVRELADEFHIAVPETRFTEGTHFFIDSFHSVPTSQQLAP